MSQISMIHKILETPVAIIKERDITQSFLLSNTNFITEFWKFQSLYKEHDIAQSFCWAIFPSLPNFGNSSRYNYNEHDISQSLLLNETN